MEFGPSKAQRMLCESTRDLLKQFATVERVREVMETDDAVDRELRGALADQGALGLLIDEQHGGSGLGLFEAALVSQELGSCAAPFDLVTSGVVAPLLIASAANEDQRSEWLPKLASGDQVVAVVRGVEEQDGVLSGTSTFSPAVNQAGLLLVEIGGCCFLVDKSAPGIDIEHLQTVDETRRWSEVSFDRVKPVRFANRVRAETLANISRAAQVAVAADSLGACYRAVEIAVDYAKGREQFGRIIGSFQAVKHLCAEMITDVDPLQSLVWYAAYAWDQQQPDAEYVAPLCKAHSAEVGYDCVTKATQVFGGIGFTWECDMHLFFKRVQVDRQWLGRPEQHRAIAAAAQVA